MDLQLGSTDSVSVTNLQKNLAQLNISPLTIDGVFGPQTESAVKAFQQGHGLRVDGVAGTDTQSAIAKALIGQISFPPTGPSPWMDWMRAHLGEVEQTGAAATAFDKEVFSHTSYGNLDGIMEPGCAATVSAALEESGYKSAHSAWADAYRIFGEACDLKPGAIVGFRWDGEVSKAPVDHVTFCDHIVDGKYVACLGGNQGHKVQVSTFSRSCIAFVRWPTQLAPAPAVPVEK